MQHRILRIPWNLHSREISVFAGRSRRGNASVSIFTRLRLWKFVQEAQATLEEICFHYPLFLASSPFLKPPSFSREGEPRKFVIHDVSAGQNENATAKLPISSPQIFLASPAPFRSLSLLRQGWSRRSRRFFLFIRKFASHQSQREEQR